MGDYDWLGPAIQAGAGMMSSQQNVDASNANQDLMRQAYLRALGLLDSGELSYTPAKAGNLGPSQGGSVEADPGAIMAEKQALSRLQEASTEGYNTIDRAAMNHVLSDANTNERMQREAALSKLDPNSGAASAARMSAQQSGANRANATGLDIAAQSRKRALDALAGYGNMASKIRGESFGEGASRAGARDAFSKFNAETSRFNAGQANSAAQHGISNKLAAMGIATGATGAYAGANTAAGQARANQLTGIGNAAGGAANAANESGTKNKDTSGTYNGEPIEPPTYIPDDEGYDF